jgi:uncharacterized protein (TIGR02466 family)
MISNRIEVVHPFEPIVHKLHFDFNWELLKPICKHLIDTTEKEVYIVRQGKSSVFNSKQPHELQQFKSFYEWLVPLVKDIIVSKSGYAKYSKYGIGNSWVNVHESNGQTTEHNHPETMFVAAAYLYMPENGGYIEFKDPLEYHKSKYNHENENWTWNQIPTISGDVLIFPGWLDHRTQTNLSNEKRWVLTTNFYQDTEPDSILSKK